MKLTLSPGQKLLLVLALLCFGLPFLLPRWEFSLIFQLTCIMSGVGCLVFIDALEHEDDETLN